METCIHSERLKEGWRVYQPHVWLPFFHCFCTQLIVRYRVTCGLLHGCCCYFLMVQMLCSVLQGAGRVRRAGCWSVVIKWCLVKCGLCSLCSAAATFVTLHVTLHTLINLWINVNKWSTRFAMIRLQIIHGGCVSVSCKMRWKWE